MKQKLFSILLTLSALTLAACGGADNISDAVVTYLPELTANDTVDSPSQEDTAVPEDAAAPEDDPGTAAGTEEIGRAHV